MLEIIGKVFQELDSKHIGMLIGFLIMLGIIKTICLVVLIIIIIILSVNYFRSKNK